jgi:multiple antibiotic resistance protein
MQVIGELFSMAFTLWLLMDSLGNVPMFLSLLRHIPAERVRPVIIRELLIALGFILFFAVLGDVLFDILGIREDAVQISGGIILFLIAIRMIFPTRERASIETDGEPFVVPLAVPLVAGPSVLTAVMVYAQQTSWPVLIGAILIAWLATVLILVSGVTLKRILGERGLIACERLMGLVLTLMAIQMFLEGLRLFIGSCRPA